jgi:hypothetical protein
MEAGDDDEKMAEEIKHLFAELREVYARMAGQPLPPNVSEENAANRYIEERKRASAIIQRIKEIQDL